MLVFNHMKSLSHVEGIPNLHAEHEKPDFLLKEMKMKISCWKNAKWATSYQGLVLLDLGLDSFFFFFYKGSLFSQCETQKRPTERGVNTKTNRHITNDVHVLASHQDNMSAASTSADHR